MNPVLEIIIPARNAGVELKRTIASLVAQTDHQFSVLLGEDHTRIRARPLDAAEQQLTAAGITVRRAKPPFALDRIEYWNWVHAQSQADWLKPLFPGEQLSPAYIERVRQRMAEQPQSKIIRCDLEVPSEWGLTVSRAPFDQSSGTAAEIARFFPARVDWLSPSINFAYSRTAWLAMGGYSVQLPAMAVLNLNICLALHYGLENISQNLALADTPDDLVLNRRPAERVSEWLELWLIFRQMKNYCVAAKLPWLGKPCFFSALLATINRS